MKISNFSFFTRLRTWLKYRVKAITPGKNALKGATLSLSIFAGIIWLLLAIGSSISIKDPWSLLLYLAVIITSVIVGLLLIFIIKLLHDIPRHYKRVLFVSIPLLFISFAFEYYIIIFFIIIASMLGASVGVLKRPGYKNLSMEARILTIIGVFLGVSGLATFIILYIPAGFDENIPENAALKSPAKIEHIQASSPADKGSYKVKILTYGSGKDKHRSEFGANVNIKTDSANGLPFIDNWRGFGGWARTKYWGFDARSLPLNARVWYPEGEGPFPLVLVVHGNHFMQDYSDPGYDYLGELLASRGYILASVDENFINGSWSNIIGWLKKENDARAWLLLEHLRLWHQWNKIPNHVFYDRVDTNNICLIGHSRGGEAVGHAACFNTLPYYPDDALVKFNYNFNIQSVIAIAPCDGQYKPAKSKTAFKNVSYLVLHGAHDADVSTYMGSRQYERISFTDSLYHFKSGLYIYGANHGQFNTTWGNNDIAHPFTGLLNLKQLLPEKDQRQIAEVYISAFLEATLNKKTEYLPLFADARTGSDWLPETIYLNQFEDSKTRILCNFDEDLNLGSLGKHKDAISGENLSVWHEQLITLKSGNKGTRAVYLGWNDKDSIQAVYSISLDNVNLELDSLSVFCFSVADAGEESDPRSKGKWQQQEQLQEGKKDEGKWQEQEQLQEEKKDKGKRQQQIKEPIDFTIQLEDSAGQIVKFPLSSFSYLQPTFKPKLMKVDFISNDDDEWDVVFQIFLYPLSDISKINPEFDYKHLNKISFIFDRSKKGVVIIDKIGFMENLRAI